MTRFTNPVRGARCADRATTRVAPIAVKLTNGSRADSLPPCGGGTGWGVVPWGTVVSLGSTPTQEGRPLPSPQGGGEQSAATSNLNLAPMRVAPTAGNLEGRRLRALPALWLRVDASIPFRLTEAID